MQRRRDVRHVSTAAKILTIAIATVLLVAACASPSPQPATQPAVQPTTQPAAQAATQPAAKVTASTAKRSLIIGTASQLENLDATKGYTPASFMIRSMIEGLVRYGTGNEPGTVLDLAQSMTISDDLKVWTVKLRQGVSFYDGTPFNSAAVKSNVDRWLNPATRIYNRANLGPLSGIEVVDDYTLKLISSEANLRLPEALSQGSSGFYSPKDLKSYSDEELGLRVTSGTGPYRVVNFVPRERIELQRVDAYWGTAPNLDSITLATIADPEARVAALERGEIDVALELGPSQLARVEANSRLQVVTGLSARQAFLSLNQLVKPLDDPKVRQAIWYAIDRNALATSVLRGYARVSDSVACKGCIDYAPIDWQAFDVTKSKSLLDEAGWRVGSDGIRTKDGTQLSFDFQAPRGRWLQDAATAQAIDGFLRNVGIAPKLRITEFATFFDAIRSPNRNSTNQAILMSWGYVAAGVHLDQIYLCSRMEPPLYNLDGYCNQDYDKMVAQLNVTSDSDKRVALITSIEQKLVKDVVDLPLYQIKALAGVRKGIEGVDQALAPTDWHRFFYVKP